MTKRILIEPAAESELAEGIAWYDEHASGAGIDLEAATLVRVRQLAESAARGVPVPGVRPDRPIHRVFLEDFPYAVIYVDGPDAIYVIAFAHFKRRPRYWLDRIEGVLAKTRSGE